LGAFLALHAKNRAFRSKSSEAPMRFLWAFRSNPWRRAASEFAERKFAASQDAWASSKIAYAILPPAPSRGGNFKKCQARFLIVYSKMFHYSVKRKNVPGTFWGLMPLQSFLPRNGKKGFPLQSSPIRGCFQ
jgi:hypothetical protein